MSARASFSGCKTILPFLWKKRLTVAESSMRATTISPSFAVCWRANDDFVAVENARVDHGGALHAEHKEILTLKFAGGEGIIVLVIFIGENRLSRRDGTDQGNIDGGASADADGTLFVIRFAQKAAVLQPFYIAVDSGGGLDAAFLTDFPHGGRIAVFFGKPPDIIHHLCQFFFIDHVGIPPSDIPWLYYNTLF